MARGSRMRLCRMVMSWSRPITCCQRPAGPPGQRTLKTCRLPCAGCESNAGTLGINPNEIVAMGESAGANLATLLGTYSTQNTGTGVSSAVDAVIASSTPTDLTTLY